MKKSNFKKLAVMGMTAGMLASAQATTALNAAELGSTHLAAGSCGGGSCGARTSRNYQRSGCGAQTQPQPYYDDYTADAQGTTYYNQGYNQPTQVPSSQGYNYNRPTQGTSTYYSPQGATTSTVNTQQENDFRAQLSNEGKMLFNGLDAEGRALAIRLASQSNNKNEAVKEAAKRMADKRSGNVNTNTNTYQR